MSDGSAGYIIGTKPNKSSIVRTLFELNVANNKALIVLNEGVLEIEDCIIQNNQSLKTTSGLVVLSA